MQGDLHRQQSAIEKLHAEMVGAIGAEKRKYEVMAAQMNEDMSGQCKSYETVLNQKDKDMHNMKASYEARLENQQRTFDEALKQERALLNNQREHYDKLLAQKETDQDNLKDHYEVLCGQLRIDMSAQKKSYDVQLQQLAEERDRLKLSYDSLLHQKAEESAANASQIDRLGEECNGLRQKLALQLEVQAGVEVKLGNATDGLLGMEEKVYKSNKISLEILKQLKDAEMEIAKLQQYVIDLKQRIAVYIPVKDDRTDQRLAEYINNYPERSKLKIMFMRESEGVYQFGTKRIFVKVESNSIKIRVGGGYLSIDEFLDQYTPVELERLERQDPLRRFNEKVAVQKTIIN